MSAVCSLIWSRHSFIRRSYDVLGFLAIGRAFYAECCTTFLSSEVQCHVFSFCLGFLVTNQEVHYWLPVRVFPTWPHDFTPFCAAWCDMFNHHCLTQTFVSFFYLSLPLFWHIPWIRPHKASKTKWNPASHWGLLTSASGHIVRPQHSMGGPWVGAQGLCHSSKGNFFCPNMTF